MSIPRAPRLTPSSMPYVAQCRCWERKPTPPGPAALRGTALDSQLRLWLENPSLPRQAVGNARLTEDDMDALEWAKESILGLCHDKPVTSAKSDCKIKLEVEGVIISGEMDAFCPGIRGVFDLKSGAIRDYKHQMLPYMCYGMMMTNSDSFAGHLVFCDQREVTTLEYSREEVCSTLTGMVLSWTDPNKQPKKCDACKYCNHADATGRCRYGVRGGALSSPSR